jgi:transcriptional regulator with XRE-family HTH domain
MTLEHQPTTGGVPWQGLLDWLLPEMRRQALTPSELARGAGVPLSTLSGVLNGKHHPSLQTLDRLARFFGRPLSELRSLAGDEAPPTTSPSPLDLTVSSTLNPEGARIQELGWILHELAPQLSPEELEGFVDYARYLRDRKRRGRRASGE